jgi:Transposase DDE domain
LGPSDSSEREHMRQMIAELPPRALLVADAGFPSYDLWLALTKAGCELVMRVGGNVRLLRKLGYARERGDLVYLWPDRAAAREQPPIVLRLVVIHNGRHPVYLVTTVLEHDRLSDQQVIEFYRLRWGIELFYRHVKQTYEMRKLRCHAAENAPVEAAWGLLGMWAMAFYAQCHLQARGIPPSKISMAQVLRAFRTPMRAYKSRPDPEEDLHALLAIAVIDSYHRASKTSRDYPRKKQETAAGPPRVFLATTTQRQKAREIREEMELRLTA